MNTSITILILAILIIFTICAFFKGWADYLWGLLGSLVTCLFLLVSLVCPVGIPRFQNFPATATKVGNEIIVQSDCPTLIVNKIEFIDEELYVTRKTLVNGWGLDLDSEYSVKKVKSIPAVEIGNPGPVVARVIAQ